MKAVVWLWIVLDVLPAAAKVFLTSPGQSITIECGEDDIYSDLAWYHKSKLIIKIYQSGILHKGKTEIAVRTSLENTNLVINQVKESDAGMFKCEIKGKSHEHTLLVATVSANPTGDLLLGSKATLKCQVSGLIGSNVQWKNPFGNPHMGSELNPVTRSDEGSWNCMFSHYGVTYDVKLDVKVTEPAPTTPAPNPSASSDGIPDARCTNCVTTLSHDEEPLLGLNWWMWVVIGVACVVLLVLMVTIFCLYKMIKKKKRKLMKRRNGHQPLTPRRYCQCIRPTAAAKLEQRHGRKRQSAPPLQLLLAE
ncbi:T-cell surface glycoprotein CD4-like [Antennarius striatus]|uniref:T-cell surface glycoprotein CD4-like n=1 Tax=Antennarius striatus TaxID=241820 RepID=UPI0035B37757